jgi:hypothetical protein
MHVADFGFEKNSLIGSARARGGRRQAGDRAHSCADYVNDAAGV